MHPSKASVIAPRLYPLLALSVLTLAGLLFRIVYARTISLHVDEFISLLAIRGLMWHGYPLLPSGTLYEQGLLFSYAEALLLEVFGFSALVGRAFSVALGTTTIVVVYYIGSKLFSRHVGVVSAAMVAFSPEAIAWGARVRMYALLQLLVLLAVWFLWRGGTEERGARCRWIAILCYLGALFTHPVSVLLFVPLALSLTLLRGVRAMLRPTTIPELLVPLCGILTTLLLKAVGQPGQLQSLAESRPYLAPSLNLAEAWPHIAPFFLGAERIPVTAVAALGLVVVLLLVLSARAGASGEARERDLLAPLLLYTILVCTMLEMVFLVGPTWRDVRYLFMVEPLLFLTASWAAVFCLKRAGEKLLGRLGGSWRRLLRGADSAWLATSLLVVAVCLLFLPAARTALARQEWGYDLAFQYLAEQWQEGDVVMTIVPYACALYIPQCDYYASGRAYEEYVFEKDGELIDRWVGAPLLNSVSQLESVLKESSRTWLVIDGWRLAARFDLGFVRTVAEQMEVAYEAQGVRVLLAEGYRPRAQAATSRSVSVDFGDQIRLVRYELSGSGLPPGSDLEMTLYWQASRPVGEEYTVFIHLRGQDGSLVSQDDYPPLKNLYPTYYWADGQTIPDPRTLSIPEDVAPGWYRLEVGLYGSDDDQRLPVADETGAESGDSLILDYVWLGEPTGLLPSHRIAANLGNQVQLMGHDGGPRLTKAGQSISLTLYWQALREMADDYSVFVHLVDSGGGVVAQHDGQPLRGFYPTSFWDAGEIVRDAVDVPVSTSVPGGEYKLVAGMYLLGTGERLPVLNENGQAVGDTVFLGEVTVAER